MRARQTSSRQCGADGGRTREECGTSDVASSDDVAPINVVIVGDGGVFDGTKRFHLNRMQYSDSARVNYTYLDMACHEVPGAMHLAVSAGTYCSEARPWCQTCRVYTYPGETRGELCRCWCSRGAQARLLSAVP